MTHTNLTDYMNELWTAHEVVGYGTIASRRVMYGGDIQVCVHYEDAEPQYLDGKDMFEAHIELA
jgi:hypothetical protein